MKINTWVKPSGIELELHDGELNEKQAIGYGWRKKADLEAAKAEDEAAAEAAAKAEVEAAKKAAANSSPKPSKNALD